MRVRREMLMRSRTQNTSCASASGGPRPSGGPTGYRRRLPVLAATLPPAAAASSRKRGKRQGHLSPFFWPAALPCRITPTLLCVRHPAACGGWLQDGAVHAWPSLWGAATYG